MANYLGESCPVCNINFASDDDIVVCPECGTPHHRDCYKQSGGCANEAKHNKGEYWQPSVLTENKEEIKCPNCGTGNDKESEKCSHCKKSLKNSDEMVNSSFLEYCENDDTSISFTDFLDARLDKSKCIEKDVTVQNICDFVGKNYISFILKFQQYKAGKSFSFNFPAFLFSHYYCFYRKMFKMGMILFLISALTYLPTAYYSFMAVREVIDLGIEITFPLYFDVSGDAYQALVVCNYVNQIVAIATKLYCGMFFNNTYYNEIVSKVKKTKEANENSSGNEEFARRLASNGGTSFRSLMTVIGVEIGYYFMLAFVGSAVLVGML